MSALELSRWAVAGLFGALFVCLAAINARVMVLTPRPTPSGRRGPSPVPMIGGIFGAIACLIAPDTTVRWLAGLPLLLDPGCLWLLGQALRSIRREEEQVLASARTPEVERLRHATTGCLLGTAVGDALGLAGEGMSRQRLARIFPDPSRYHFFFGRGWCSDDTEHACLTAQAFLAAQQNRPAPDVAVFAEELASKLRWWLVGLPAGIGLATGRAILKLWLGWPAAKSGVRSAGNGPAMRAPILGVLLGDDAERLTAFVRASTQMTHRDPEAAHGALAVAWAAHLAARPPAEHPSTWARACSREICQRLPPDATKLIRLIEAAAASVVRGEDTTIFATSIGCAGGVSGYMLHTVPVALHAAWSHPLDLGAALSAAVRCGGDTDSVAAIVGGIVGARVGPPGIAPHFLDGLGEWPRNVRWLERLGTMLALTRAPDRIAFPLRLNVPGLLARNLFFLAVVLAHGFRRVLPPYR